MIVIDNLKKGNMMGNERKGYKRMTFFLQDNIALQVRENAYINNGTLTNYITESILRRIEDERTRQLEDAQKDMSTL